MATRMFAHIRISLQNWQALLRATCDLDPSNNRQPRAHELCHGLLGGTCDLDLPTPGNLPHELCHGLLGETCDLDPSNQNTQAFLQQLAVLCQSKAIPENIKVTCMRSEQIQTHTLRTKHTKKYATSLTKTNNNKGNQLIIIIIMDGSYITLIIL